jgi:drug/metabolite transporter (DMT)-like permease
MTGARSNTSAHGRGVALCVVSAVGFGLMAIFAKEAYRGGAGVPTLLSLRFTLAAAAFWAIVAVRRPARPERRTILAGLGLGAVGYALQSGAYFAALTRIDASLTSLLLYTYPALVFAAALVLGRERVDRRRLVALALASAGAALVLLGGGAGSPDGLGVALGLGAAVAYTVYILTADRITHRIDPFLLSALVTTGAAVSVWSYTAISGRLDVAFGARGWIALAGLSLLSTVLPIRAFLAGLPKVGPATASIVSTIEPVVTVSLAVAVLGEGFAPIQGLGAVLVLGAVVLLQARARVRGDVPAPADAAGPAPARPLAQQPA